METLQSNKPELADVFRLVKKTYLESSNLTYYEEKTFHNITSCRTASMGGHIDKCNTCDYTTQSYNSCRNRHCPKCQFTQREKWILDRHKDLLPISYMHIVFTIPHELNSIIINNKKILYELLFNSASSALQLLEKDGKYLAAKTGFIFVLHTWGQTLSFHPHIHCIITGGGISGDGNWKDIKNNFLFPVKVLSRLFRGKYLSGIKKLISSNHLFLPADKENIPKTISSLYKKDWVVYTKEPFQNPDHLIQYLGRYTHRIAISNNRILEITDTNTTFSYKDYSDGNKRKAMTLSNYEFTRRFMQHILPFRFCKIRYYGILANRTRRDNIHKIRNELKQKDRVLAKSILKPTPKVFTELKGIYKCIICKVGVMIVIETFERPKQPP